MCSGLGVTITSELAYIEFCRKMAAVLREGSERLAISQTLSTWTSLLGCSQNITEYVSLSYSPFDIIPCSLGYFPESILACTVQVTAGKTGSIFAACPAAAILAMLGTR